MKVVSLTPIKLNNERIPGKNTKLFYDGTPLTQFVFKTLLKCKTIDESYVYCSQNKIKDYLMDGIKYLKRDEKYDTATANVNDMFYAFSETVPADIYVLAHCTAPFQTPYSIDEGVEAVKSGSFDSALTVKRMQDFFWTNGKPLNYSPVHIPRTQDLNPMFVETTGLYIFTKDVIKKLHRRIGDKPYLIEVSEVEATDINNPMDFEIADALYKNGLTYFSNGDTK